MIHMVSEEIKKDIWIFALDNAVQFKGKASQGAVVGKLFAKDPSLKKEMKSIAPEIGKIIAEINSMEPDDQKAKLKELVPDIDEKKKEEKKERKKSARELPPLKDAEDGKIVTRMAPGPSKYPHIGHAISFGINHIYAKSYNGRCIMRIDDTNPEVDSKEFVDSMHDGITRYLGMTPDEICYASDNMDKLYEHAENLIKEGKAYACDSSPEEMSEQRRNMRPSPRRDSSVKENLEIWEGMKRGENESFALRLKIDMTHKNAVMRDPVVFRVIQSKHYRQGDKYKAWPTYDFESTVIDGILGITHVLRSNEFDSRIELHNHISSILGYDEVNYRHYGRVNITGSLTQGREIRKNIESGDFIGWDDPRLVTLKALERRGIVKDSIVNIVKMAGLSKQNTNIDFSVIASENRKILDQEAKRFFMLKDPVSIRIEGAPEQEIELNTHPVKKEGGRRFNTGEAFMIEKKDLDKIEDGKLIRLMDCLNFKKEGEKFVFYSKDYMDYKKDGEMIIHWLPDNGSNEEATIVMGDSSEIRCIVEKSISHISPGDIIQFERFGFCRLDSKEDAYKFWFSHE